MLLNNFEQKLLALEKYFNDHEIFRYSPSLKSPALLKFRSYLLTSTKIRFLIYWGIGYKKEFDIVDHQAIEYQKKIIIDISEILNLDYVVQYIITDTHATINNIPQTTVHSYIESAKKNLQSYKYNTMLMSSLLKKYHIPEIKKLIDSYNIEHILNNASYKSLLDGLVKQSQKYPIMGNSLDYLKSNIIENSIIEEEFSEYIFITYSAPETKLLLPNLPKLYTYVNKDKQIKRPWFNEGKK